MAGRRGAVKILGGDYAVGDVVIVQAIIIHPMETGFGKDQHSGVTKPRFFVKKIVAYFNDTQIASFDLEVTSSQNPKLKFPYKVTGPGEIKVVFTNNMGEELVKTTKVEPK